jgi:PAS domain S-box-containing protein
MHDSNPNQLFESAFQHAAIGMALVAPDGHWLRVNPAACAMVGYTEPELRERTFQDITHPDDLASDLAQVRKMLSGEIQTYQMEKRYFHKKGHLVCVLLSVSLVRNDDGSPKFFISQIVDVTAQKVMECALAAALREKDGLLKKLHEALTHGLPDEALQSTLLDIMNKAGRAGGRA